MAKDTGEITIDPIRKNIFALGIRGISPLQTHRFGEASLASLRGTLQGSGTKAGKKTVRDPDAEFKEALYSFDENKVGFPSIMPKMAMVNACRTTKLTMAEAKQMFFTWGHENPNFCTVNHVEPEVHEAIVPAAKGKGSTLAYRAIYPIGWESVVMIEHNPDVIGESALANLLNNAGFSVGLGCQRPERGGQYGRFEIITQ
jgi:hypothetical protein